MLSLKFNLIIVNILRTCNVELDLSAAGNNFLNYSFLLCLEHLFNLKVGTYQVHKRLLVVSIQSRINTKNKEYLPKMFL